MSKEAELARWAALTPEERQRILAETNVALRQVVATFTVSVRIAGVSIAKFGEAVARAYPKGTPTA